ncbi:MAG TPA: hypothetical protein VFW05_06775, partial [Verrucomicrobiae bacterium]|nr:hypothetical protein [Verrucomicrobiae bacterium]
MQTLHDSKRHRPFKNVYGISKFSHVAWNGHIRFIFEMLSKQNNALTNGGNEQMEHTACSELGQNNLQPGKVSADICSVVCEQFPAHGIGMRSNQKIRQHTFFLPAASPIKAKSLCRRETGLP